MTYWTQWEQRILRHIQNSVPGIWNTYSLTLHLLLQKARKTSDHELYDRQNLQESDDDVLVRSAVVKG
jgi:hypothetical protein